MAEAVEAKELTRRFGDFLAVDRVSFSVAPGEVFGFLGPNGAGKTTTIKMLTGLLPPSRGTARVAGYDVATESRLVRQHLGYMSQLFSLYSDLTVEENIRLFAGLYGVTGRRYRERRDWVLETAGLKDQRNRLTGELALGHKQRLALGCAVLHEPPILFLDEPTSGVDPASRRSFWELIYQLAQKGTTVLVTTHYMDEAEYCYRLALMHRGRLVAVDSPTGLRRSVAVPILELEVADAVRAVEVLVEEPGVLEAGMFGRKVHVIAEQEPELPARIVARLQRAGVTVYSLKPVPPSLEDVFVALVRKSSRSGS